MARKLLLFTFMALPSFTSVAVAQKKVLFVMSAARELPLRNNKTYDTGVFLGEFYLAYQAIVRSGYEVDFATPGGIPATIDAESLDKKYWGAQSSLIGEAERFVRDDEKFNNPRTLEEALENVERYAGLVVPGGQGLMADLIHDRTIPRLLSAFSTGGKAIGLICHAPALLLTFPDERNPFAGYRVNSVTGLEELFIETFVMKGKPRNRKIAKQLRKAGLKYRKGRPAGNFAVRDRGLVTSQNPYSSRAFVKLYLEALDDQGALPD